MINICNRCQRDCKGEHATCQNFKSFEDKGYKRELRMRIGQIVKDAAEEALKSKPAPVPEVVVNDVSN